MGLLGDNEAVVRSLVLGKDPFDLEEAKDAAKTCEVRLY
jgi:hypothetical protein